MGKHHAPVTRSIEVGVDEPAVLSGKRNMLYFYLKLVMRQHLRLCLRLYLSRHNTSRENQQRGERAQRAAPRRSSLSDGGVTVYQSPLSSAFVLPIFVGRNRVSLDPVILGSAGMLRFQSNGPPATAAERPVCCGIEEIQLRERFKAYHFNMSGRNPKGSESHSPDRSLPADIRLREEPEDEEEEDEEEHDGGGEDEEEDGDEGYSE